MAKPRSDWRPTSASHQTRPNGTYLTAAVSRDPENGLTSLTAATLSLEAKFSYDFSSHCQFTLPLLLEWLRTTPLSKVMEWT